MQARRAFGLSAVVGALLAATAAWAALPQLTGQVDLLSGANVRVSGAADDLLDGTGVGVTVAGVGDVNADGYADFAVAAPGADHNGRLESGSVHVILGHPTVTEFDVNATNNPGFRIDGPEASAYPGSVDVEGIGDINADGHADLALALTLSSDVYVVYGSDAPSDVDLGALGTRGFRVTRAPGTSLNDLAGVGDMNADGYADFAIGAPYVSNNGREWSGSTYVIFGRLDSTDIDVDALGANGFRIDGAAPRDKSGWSLAGVGDMNADGRPDLAIGAPRAGGSTYVVFGRPNATNIDLDILGTQGFRIDGRAGSIDHYGLSVAGVGDMNGDGHPDLAVGGGRHDGDTRPAPGPIVVVYGTPNPRDVAIATIGNDGFFVTGHWGDLVAVVAGVGDMNSDGLPDLALRPNTYSAGTTVYVIYGQANRTTNVDVRALEGDGLRINDPEYVTLVPAGIGDFNGDGHPDLAVGRADYGLPGEPVAGSAHVIFGFGAASINYPQVTATVGFPITTTIPKIARTGNPTFSATGLPAGIRINPATGALAGTPPTSGTTSASIMMKDLTGTTTAKTRIVIRRCTAIRRGNNRSNTIRGDRRSEYILGRGGNDLLTGGPNEDCLSGETGNDTLYGGLGNDTLSAGPGRDIIYAGQGNDAITAGPGNDTVHGNSGDDVIAAGKGNDTIDAGKGNDAINSRDGEHDSVSCGPGRDTATVDRTDTTRGCERLRRL